MFDHAVVGAGIHGLCTAFWLRRRGSGSIVVLDRHGPGHDLGSSHGDTRIMRASYADPGFVKLAGEALSTGWPTLEREIGRPLLTATPGVFFGPPGGPFGAYLQAAELSPAMQPLSVTEARRRFPLRFDDRDAVLLDHTAAMIHAADAMQGLRDWLRTHDVKFVWHTQVLGVETEADMVVLQTATGTTAARSVVLASGAFLVAPALQTRVTALRQQVGYFDLDLPPTARAAGVFPVWARIGHDQNDFEYGLPDHRGRGLKLAQHRTIGVGIDPASKVDPIDEPGLLQLARRRFVPPVLALRATESCLYGMTPDQGFRIERRQRRPAIVSIAACSGHGFKFGPVIGRQACDLLCSD